MAKKIDNLDNQLLSAKYPNEVLYLYIKPRAAYISKKLNLNNDIAAKFENGDWYWKITLSIPTHIQYVSWVKVSYKYIMDELHPRAIYVK